VSAGDCSPAYPRARLTAMPRWTVGSPYLCE
jgi:hypothetical protein